MDKPRVTRHTCQQCHSHRAVFLYQGRWSACRDHDLCPRCFRSLMASLDARRAR